MRTRAGVRAVLAPVQRMTAGRKEALVLRLARACPHHRAAILAEAGVTEEEAATYERRFSAHGRKGLHQLQTQRTRA